MQTVTGRLLELGAAVVLIAMLVSPVVSNETTGNAGIWKRAEVRSAGEESLHLFSSPRLPWWMAADVRGGSSSHSLLGGKIETLGPFLLEPTSPSSQFSSNLQAGRPRVVE